MFTAITNTVHLVTQHGHSFVESAAGMSSTSNAHHLGNEVGTTVLLVIAIALSIGMIITNVLFCLSAYRAMKLVPKEKQLFPGWMIWLIFVPIAGYVIIWMMEPFGIPTSFKNATEGNPQAAADSKTLFGIGLAHVIVATLVFIPVIGAFLCLPASLILWIIYWVKMVAFKNNYLKSNS